MIVTKKALPRRTFLRGAGAALSLPLLDAMIPALTTAADTPADPARLRRLGFVYMPMGSDITRWTPPGVDVLDELSPSLSPLEAVKSQVTVITNLDPGEPAGLPQCCEVALLVRERLAERGLEAKPVTSGSKGLHLYAALPGRLNSDGTTALAKEVAEELQAAHPKLVTATMTKSRRSGKVFLDWSQNAGSKTTLSPYSLRGKEKPYVAAPLSWEEVESGAEDPVELEQLRFEEVLERVAADGDLLAGLG